MNTLELKAIDTLFFKDGKPFSMGEETWAQGIFPPFPSVIFGMLNSCYIADRLFLLEGIKTANDLDTGLAISGYLPTLKGEPAFPVPNDLFIEKEENGQQAYLLDCIAKPENLLTDYPNEYLLQTNRSIKIEELAGKALLDLSNFKKWLNGEAKEFSFHRLNQYITDEPKVGIGREFNTRTASEGLLYRVAMKRLAGKDGHLTLLVKYSGFDLGNGISRFGAENKSIAYTKANFPEILCPVNINENKFKIYLATTSIFEEGHYPARWFENNGLKLLAAAIGRAQHTGGFDVVAGKPKTMRKAVPAGTVYYVQVIDTTKTADILKKLHQQSIYNLSQEENGYYKEYKKQGFGLTYVGKLNL